MRVKLFEADSNDISLSTLKFRKIEIDDLLFFFFFEQHPHSTPQPSFFYSHCHNTILSDFITLRHEPLVVTNVINNIPRSIY